MKKTSSPVDQGEIIGGRYRVEQVIGHGGMSEVLAATDLHLGHRVAIKVLVAATTERMVARFLREARVVGRLRSEHAVRVLDAGELDTGRPYIVLEHLEGMDLSKVLKERGVLSVPEAVGHVLQASVAVAEAHRLGIVHRDLKPSNLFLATMPDGTRTIKVLDFGISKLLEGEGQESVSVLTRSHETLGTPHYMAPEQLRSSRRVDARADVWSMGVILYQLLTGRLPIETRLLHDRIAMMLRGERPQPPRRHRPGLPAPLDAAIMRCLEYDREQRFASIAELAAAIAPYGADQGAARMEEIQSLPPPVAPILDDDAPPPCAPTPAESATEPRTRVTSAASPTLQRFVLFGLILCAVVLLAVAVRVLVDARARLFESPPSNLQLSSPRTF